MTLLSGDGAQEASKEVRSPTVINLVIETRIDFDAAHWLILRCDDFTIATCTSNPHFVYMAEAISLRKKHNTTARLGAAARGFALTIAETIYYRTNL